MYTIIYIILVILGTCVVLPFTVFLLRRMIKGFEDNIKVLFSKLEGLPCQEHGERLATIEGIMQRDGFKLRNKVKRKIV